MINTIVAIVVTILAGLFAYGSFTQRERERRRWREEYDLEDGVFGFVDRVFAALLIGASMVWLVVLGWVAGSAA